MNNNSRDLRILLVGGYITIIGAGLLWVFPPQVGTPKLGILLLPGIVTLLIGVASNYELQSVRLATPLILIGGLVVGVAAIAFMISSMRMSRPLPIGAVIALVGAALSVLGVFLPRS